MDTEVIIALLFVALYLLILVVISPSAPKVVERSLVVNNAPVVPKPPPAKMEPKPTPKVNVTPSLDPTLKYLERWEGLTGVKNEQGMKQYLIGVLNTGQKVDEDLFMFPKGYPQMTNSGEMEVPGVLKQQKQWFQKVLPGALLDWRYQRLLNYVNVKNLQERLQMYPEVVSANDFMFPVGYGKDMICIDNDKKVGLPKELIPSYNEFNTMNFNNPIEVEDTSHRIWANFKGNLCDLQAVNEYFDQNVLRLEREPTIMLAINREYRSDFPGNKQGRDRYTFGLAWLLGTSREDITLSDLYQAIDRYEDLIKGSKWTPDYRKTLSSWIHQQIQNVLKKDKLRTSIPLIEYDSYNKFQRLVFPQPGSEPLKEWVDNRKSVYDWLTSFRDTQEAVEKIIAQREKQGKPLTKNDFCFTRKHIASNDGLSNIGCHNSDLWGVPISLLNKYRIFMKITGGNQYNLNHKIWEGLKTNNPLDSEVKQYFSDRIIKIIDNRTIDQTINDAYNNGKAMKWLLNDIPQRLTLKDLYPAIDTFENFTGKPWDVNFEQTWQEHLTEKITSLEAKLHDINDHFTSIPQGYKNTWSAYQALVDEQMLLKEQAMIVDMYQKLDCKRFQMDVSQCLFYSCFGRMVLKYIHNKVIPLENQTSTVPAQDMKIINAAIANEAKKNFGLSWYGQLTTMAEVYDRIEDFKKYTGKVLDNGYGGSDTVTERIVAERLHNKFKGLLIAGNDTVLYPKTKFDDVMARGDRLLIKHVYIAELICMLSNTPLSCNLPEILKQFKRIFDNEKAYRGICIDYLKNRCHDSKVLFAIIDKMFYNKLPRAYFFNLGSSKDWFKENFLSDLESSFDYTKYIFKFEENEYKKITTFTKKKAKQLVPKNVNMQISLSEDTNFELYPTKFLQP
jgi:hypothetical protein